jgi:hypothetical protein
MAMKLRLLAGTSPFAHLVGIGKPVATNDKQQPDESDEHFRKRYERDTATGPTENDPHDTEVLTAEEEDRRRDGESDDEWNDRKASNARRRRAEEEDTRRDGESDEDWEDRKKKNATRRAEEEDERKRAEEEDARKRAEDDKPRDEREASRRAEEEGDSDSDDREIREKASAGPRRREKARCAAIFMEPAARQNPQLAATLAFMTDLPRDQAIAVLRSGGVAAAAPRGASLDERMRSIALHPPAQPRQEGPRGEGDLPMADRIVLAGMRRRDEHENAEAFLKERLAANARR